MKVQYKKLKMFLLGVTYRPPDCPVASFTDAFVENYMQALIHGKDIFILGDLNCDLLKSTPESRNFKRSLHKIKFKTAHHYSDESDSKLIYID